MYKIYHVNTHVGVIFSSLTHFQYAHVYLRIYSNSLDRTALTLLHSERPKLYGVLAVLSAIGLNSSQCYIMALTEIIIYGNTMQE